MKMPPTESLERLRVKVHDKVESVMEDAFDWRDVGLKGPWEEQPLESSVSLGPEGARIVVMAFIPREAWGDSYTAVTEEEEDTDDVVM